MVVDVQDIELGRMLVNRRQVLILLTLPPCDLL